MLYIKRYIIEIIYRKIIGLPIHNFSFLDLGSYIQYVRMATSVNVIDKVIQPSLCMCYPGLGPIPRVDLPTHASTW